jgi:hypothetical protein
MLQHVERSIVESTSCQAAFEERVKKWAPAQTFDSSTMRLESAMRLKVDFVTPTGAVDLCQPTAKAGFLGAENQLIRVQVAADRTSMLWGYDNASFMYRVTVDVADARVLTLAEPPVDVYHQPRVNQWVEVLASAVALGDNAFVAAPVGFAAQVVSYDPGSRIVRLSLPLDAAFLSTVVSTADVPRQVFLRMWENKQPFAADEVTATELRTSDNHGTGVQVFTTAVARVPGDFWMIGVRPSHPDTIFPSRLRSFQPPDGPGRWVVNLGVIAWQADHANAEVSDCRETFKNLVELSNETGDCCELLIKPGDDVQKKIDERLDANRRKKIYGLHVRFASGTFNVEAPIVIDASREKGDVTVSGCGLSSRLRATRQEVVLVVRGWNSATVRDLTVVAGVAAPGHGTHPRPDVFPNAPGDEFRHLGGAVTVLDCASALVEGIVSACAGSDNRAASCIHIRHAERCTARVLGCDLLAGPNQVGVQLINMTRATVEDNRIRINPDSEKPDAYHAIKKLIVDNIAISPHYQFQPQPADWRQVATKTVGEKTLRFSTETDLYDPWKVALETVNTLDDIDDFLESVADQALDDNRSYPLSATNIAPFRRFVASARKGIPSTVDRGIVIAGALAGDIRVVDNTISQVRTGVLVGVSVRREEGDPPGNPDNPDNPDGRPEPILAERAQIVGNTISQRIPRGEHGVHAGVFVGNVEVATVRDNRVTTQTGGRWVQSGEGIRVWGRFGPMVLVANNSCEDVLVGIRVRSIDGIQTTGGAPTDVAVWRVTQNFIRHQPWGHGLFMKSYFDAGDNVVVLT